MVLMPVYSYSASMDSQERSGPLSPFQQAPNSAPFLHSPAYPSPAQSDTDSSRYSANGLGLYRYSQPFPTSADRMMFSPSPQPTQAWNASSSMAPAPIVNPWTSGAYDHPVCPDGRANMLWPEYQCSHRSSISSHRELSVFSGDGSEHSFPSVKLEGGAEWDAENDLSPLATVAPSRLTNTISYDGVYGSPKSQYESDSTSAPVGKVELTSDFSPNMRPRSSHSEGNATGTRRRHQRRTKVPVEEAKFKCDICNTGFVRAYNKKTHMARHNPNRAKEHFCDYDCDMKFERRTDLVRHINSVHLKRRDWDCDLCGKKFARRDTLNRHDSQGNCPKKNEVDYPTLIARSHSMQSSPGNPMSYLPSPQPEAYAGFQPADASQGHYTPRGQQLDGGGFDGRFTQLQNRGFDGAPHEL